MTDRKKLEKYLIIGVIVLFVVISATYAFFQAQLGDGAQSDVNLSSNTTDNLTFSVSNAINLNINQFNFGAGDGNLASSATATASLLANNSSNTATYTYYVYFKINSNEYVYTTTEQKPEIILTVTNPNGEEVTSIEGLTHVTATGADGASVSGFDITTATGTFAVATQYSINANSTTPTVQDWQFTATFINLDTNQQDNAGKEMDAVILIQQNELQSFAQYIVDQVYTGIDGENDLYYHDGLGNYTNADQEAGDYSYRYSGANPNNYVCFGSNEITCPDDSLYRIIGVFNGHVKLIKNDYTTIEMTGNDSRDYYGTYSGGTSNYKGKMNLSDVTSYYWNNNNESAYGSNNWITSELNSINLNKNFISYLDKNSYKVWSNFIVDSAWYLGSMSSAGYTAKNFYVGERSNEGNEDNPITYNAKIGLMYVSDYGYAASPNNWSLNLNNSTVKNDNWMYVGLYEWSITPSSSSSYNIFLLDHKGYFGSYKTNSGYAVRPVFYLADFVEYAEGTGTASDPYRIN